MSKLYSTWVDPKTGVVKNYLNPSRKSAKYAYELRTNKRVTNNGKPKLGKNGSQLTLNKVQRSFRAGYLTAHKDSSNCYNAIKGAKKSNKYNNYFSL